MFLKAAKVLAKPLGGGRVVLEVIGAKGGKSGWVKVFLGFLGVISFLES
jgi:hypothetical protein